MVFNTFLEEISMDQKTETIITQLKNALERQEPGTNDHQWIIGAQGDGSIVHFAGWKS